MIKSDTVLEEHDKIECFELGGQGLRVYECV